jgi:hypothetical protein
LSSLSLDSQLVAVRTTPLSVVLAFEVTARLSSLTHRRLVSFGVCGDSRSSLCVEHLSVLLPIFSIQLILTARFARLASLDVVAAAQEDRFTVDTDMLA